MIRFLLNNYANPTLTDSRGGVFDSNRLTVAGLHRLRDSDPPLIGRSMNVWFSTDTPLHLCLRTGYLQPVDLLLQCGAAFSVNSGLKDPRIDWSCGYVGFRESSSLVLFPCPSSRFFSAEPSRRDPDPHCPQEGVGLG